MVDNQTSRTTRPSYKEITEETTEKTTKREAAREKTQEITTQHTHEANTPENENTEHQHSETLTHHILNGKPNPRYEQARVRNTLKRLAGNRFTSRHEFDLLSWARHTNEQLQNLYNASDPQHWPGETNKPRKFILEDLLNGDRKPPTKTSLELERETEPYTLHELIDMHKNGDADLALKLMDNYGKNTTA